eukprot:CAMPEP_0183791138 /NCGR_PEP_ID=MMETSP0803_2-20130417/1644_1 /TAXON_ID=195967 /ORGANISM="Crustomastix stigmata, Strain CCMP3273" /LENGTH=113 /DNA_ID=CAMNT_0026035437 /DNA_START=92 /DNA_END=433 /DNA_ORIENTATION=+
MATDLKALATKYFEMLNTKDASNLAPLLAENAVLLGGKTKVESKAEFLEAQAKVFKSLPGVQINIKAVYADPEALKAFCENSVVLADDVTGNAMDVISFSAEGLITCLDSYKQ